MNPSAANQIAHDNALVAPEARLKIGECNRRIEFTKPQREATYQVTLDALKLSPCYPGFQITSRLDSKRFRVNAEVFRDILQICPKIPDQPFDIPPSIDEEILSSKARDDSLLGTLKYVSKTEERQVYGALIPKEMINEDILNSTAYETYFAYANGAKKPMKARKFKKPTSPKLKTVLVSPKEPTKKPAKEATKRSKKDFHISHASGSGTDEGTGTKPGVLDVPKYDSESEKESWVDSGEKEDDDEDDYEDKSDDMDDDDDDNDVNDDNNDDDDKNDDDDEVDSDRTESSTEYNKEEKIYDEEKMDEEEDDDVTKELY
ncbi:hypothetical protein Tco_0509637 [Tanacetum coccineum]